MDPPATPLRVERRFAASPTHDTLAPVTSAAATGRFALLHRAALTTARQPRIASAVTSLHVSRAPDKRAPTHRGHSPVSRRRFHAAAFVCRAASDEDGAMTADATTRVVVWFRNDLRLNDNYVVQRAESLAASTPKCDVLPVYCFDPRFFAPSAWGTPKTGGRRARFQLECVLNLRENLRAAGSDLLVAVGKPEDVIAKHALDAPGCKTLVLTQVRALDARRERSTANLDREPRPRTYLDRTSMNPTPRPTLRADDDTYPRRSVARAATR